MKSRSCEKFTIWILLYFYLTQPCKKQKITSTLITFYRLSCVWALAGLSLRKRLYGRNGYCYWVNSWLRGWCSQSLLEVTAWEIEMARIFWIVLLQSISKPILASHWLEIHMQQLQLQATTMIVLISPKSNRFQENGVKLAASLPV